MKILLVGANGQLGTELNDYFKRKHNVIGLDIPDIDITLLENMMHIFEAFKPDIAINSAAYADVDGCEKDHDKAFLVNSLGARNLAIAAEKVGAKLVHISTDYVFDGNKNEPYKEYDKTNPINVYGISKLEGENFVRNISRKHFILRIAWLYGINGKNFIKMFLSLLRSNNEIKVVSDQFGTPTSALNIARQIEVLINTEQYGTYHCTCNGGCSWFEYALEILKNLDYEIISRSEENISLVSNKERVEKVSIIPVPMTHFSRPAKRPRYSVLDNYYLRIQGLDLMLDWRDALREFIISLIREGDIYESLGIGGG